MLPGSLARADNIKMTGKKQPGSASGGFYVCDNICSGLVPAIDSGVYARTAKLSGNYLCCG
jgi:hypothetical protein